MKVLVRLVALFFAFAIPLPACHSGDGGSASNASQKGGTNMKTYYMGRFAIDVPVEMRQAVQAQTFRLIEVQEFEWAYENRGEAREKLWHDRIAQIKELDLPRGVKKLIVEESIVKGLPQHMYARKVLYYGDFMTDKELYCDILLDAGKVGVWFKLHGKSTAVDKICSWLEEVVAAYNPSATKGIKGENKHKFFFRLGYVDLPYKRQEKTYSRFEGHPLDLKLEVEMAETHEVEKMGIARRLAVAILTQVAPGVHVQKKRSRTRTIAGLEGEEIVTRMSASGEETLLQFCWEFRGEEESGENPEIQITMETPDGDLDEKLKVWDAILDSFKPAYL